MQIIYAYILYIDIIACMYMEYGIWYASEAERMIGNVMCNEICLWARE